MRGPVPLSNLSRFARVVDHPESALNFSEAVLLIAEDAYPGLDVERYLRRLDEIAGPIREQVREDSPILDVAKTINGHLFGEIVFLGNIETTTTPELVPK
jgi:regulator of sirC expression with transglutaminase-like and TPR domain